MKMKHIVLFILVSLFILPFAITNIDSDHDGILLKPALDVASGKVLFKESLTQYGALTVFLQAAALTITPFLFGIRLSAVFSYAFIAVFLVAIWSRFLSKKLTLIALILWLSLAPFYNFYFHSWSSVYALVFQLVALLSILRYFETKKKYHLFLSGIGAALAFWSRQPVGVFLLASIFFLLILTERLQMIKRKEAIRGMGIVFIGAAFASVPFFIYLIGNYALTDWWIQSFLGAKAWAIAVRGISFIQVVKSLSIAKFWKEIHLYFIWLLLPLSALYLFFNSIKSIWHKRIKSSKEKILMVSTMILLASWMQYYPVTEPSHFFWAATPMVGFFVYFLHQFVYRFGFIFNFYIVVLIFDIYILIFYAVRVGKKLPFINENRFSQSQLI